LQAIWVRIRVVKRDRYGSYAARAWRAADYKMKMWFSAVTGVATQGNNVADTHCLLQRDHRAVLREVKVERNRSVRMRDSNNVFFTRYAGVIREGIEHSSYRASARRDEQCADGHSEVVTVLVRCSGSV